MKIICIKCSRIFEGIYKPNAIDVMGICPTCESKRDKDV